MTRTTDSDRRDGEEARSETHARPFRSLLRCLVAGGLLAAPALTLPSTLHGQVIDFFRVDDTMVPLGGAAFVEWQVQGADGVILDPAGSVAAAGSALVQPAGGYILVPAGALWIYDDSGIDRGPSDQFPNAAAWFHPAYNDAGWRIGPAPLGYGDASATVIRFGPEEDNALNDPDAKHVTTYFRTSFALTADVIAEIDLLELELRRDDGAIVYLNGIEVFRTNLPAGSVGAADVALRAVGGQEETTFFTHVLPKELLVVGPNVVAVELHQAAQTSSDLGFDLSLIGHTHPDGPATLTLHAQGPDTAPFVDFGSTWSYLADGSDQLSTPTPFHAPSFNPVAAGWPSGAADFGYNHANESTVLDPGPDPAFRPITYYFRHAFDLALAGGAAGLTADLGVRADDAAIVYLNGIEIFRTANLPVGRVDFDTVATATVADEVNFQTVTLGPLVTSLLEQNGENVLAVEVHNASVDSSDVSFDLFLRLRETDGDTLLAVPPGAVWRYDDTGVNRGPSDQAPATAWFGSAFNDSSWSQGPAELGFGDGDPATVTNTVIPYGDPATKAIAYYFRTSFELDAAQIQGIDSALLSLVRDDGAVVHLNGVEIVRDNVPDPADFITPAIAASQATTFHLVARNRFIVGTNVLAVTLHQAGPTSSDILFDLRLGPAVSESIILQVTDPPPTEPPYLTTSVPAGLHWNLPEVWVDNAIPTFDRDYAVYGNIDRTVRPGTGIDIFFGGRSLALRGPRARILLDQPAGEFAVVDVRLEGGRIESGAGPARGIDGTIEAVSLSTLSPGAAGRRLEVASSISGSADIIIDGAFAGGSVVLSGANASFSGDWLVDGIFRPAIPEALGSGAVIVRQGGAFDPAANLTNLSATVHLDDADARFVLRGDHGLGGIVVDGAPLPAGRHDFASLQARGLGAFFVDRAGSITIGANPDTDGDLLPDFWETTNFGSLAARPGDDEDGDGRTNLDEYEEGTDPTDAGSRFRIIAIDKPASTPAATLTWLGSARQDYRIHFSNDGLAWQTVATTVQGSPGATTTWTDDGSQTGVPPGTQPTRFYAVEQIDPLQ